MKGLKIGRFFQRVKTLKKARLKGRAD